MTNKVKMKMYCHKSPRWHDGEYWLSHCGDDSIGLCLGEVVVEFDRPGTPAIDAQAALIDEAMGKVRMEMEERLAALEVEKQRLLEGSAQ